MPLPGILAAGLVGAVSGGSFGAAYVGSMRTTWDAYDAAKITSQESAMPSMPNFQGSVTGMGSMNVSGGWIPLYGADGMAGISRSEMLKDIKISAPQSAEFQPSYEQQRYKWELGLAQQQLEYDRLAQQVSNADTAKAGPYLYRGFVQVGGGNWPTYFYGTASRQRYLYPRRY